MDRKDSAIDHSRTYRNDGIEYEEMENRLLDSLGMDN